MDHEPLKCTDCGSTDDVRDIDGKQLCYACTFLNKNPDVKTKVIVRRNGKIDGPVETKPPIP